MLPLPQICAQECSKGYKYKEEQPSSLFDTKGS